MCYEQTWRKVLGAGRGAGRIDKRCGRTAQFQVGSQTMGSVRSTQADMVMQLC